MPWAMIWSTLAVMVAESDLPSKMNTSAPYFSLAYFLASVAWPWWKTLVRSDTKNAIFMGLASAAAGAVVGSATGAWAAGVGVAPPPHAARIMPASSARATRANRFFFMVRFLLFAKGFLVCARLRIG